MLELVLLRHGESTWNAENLFTGWQDVDLTRRGEEEARQAGELLAAEPGIDLRILHTSVLTRAIRTADLALYAAGRSWLPVRRSWRLNERHYGDLQGRNKVETREEHGDALLQAWRRGYDTPPPPLPEGDPRRSDGDPRYRDVPPGDLPVTECLKDVVARCVPYWESALVPDLLAEARRGGAVLVVAHGNSIRALRKHIESISDADITGLEIPTGIPWRCRLEGEVRLRDDGTPGPLHLEVAEGRYLGDPGAAAAAADAVRRQAG